MRMRDEERRRPPRFCPVMTGCVAQDLRMARALEQCRREELRSVSRYTQRSLLFSGVDPDVSHLFGELAEDEEYHFRMLEELIRALGGCSGAQLREHSESPDLSRVAQRERAELLRRLVRESIREKKREIDRYQTLMGSSSDRVVRSILIGLLSDEQRHLQCLQDGALRA